MHETDDGPIPRGEMSLSRYLMWVLWRLFRAEYENYEVGTLLHQLATIDAFVFDGVSGWRCFYGCGAHGSAEVMTHNPDCLYLKLTKPGPRHGAGVPRPKPPLLPPRLYETIKEVETNSPVDDDKYGWTKRALAWLTSMVEKPNKAADAP
jgi:hypothetical protein